MFFTKIQWFTERSQSYADSSLFNLRWTCGAQNEDFSKLNASPHIFSTKKKEHSYQYRWCHRCLLPHQGWSSYEVCEVLPTLQASGLQSSTNSINLTTHDILSQHVSRWDIITSWIVLCKTSTGLETLHSISGCVIPWLYWATRLVHPGSVP
jgi:hypothetical protein